MTLLQLTLFPLLPTNAEMLQKFHYHLQTTMQLFLDMDLPTSLPTTWLKVVDHPVPGTLCKKYTKVPHSGKAVWTSKPCTLFRLQSVRRHAQSDIHEEATRQL